MKERSFGAVVVDEKGRFLLVKHRYGGHWDFPKGHMEGDESPLEAALREVLEETGLTLELFGEHVLKSEYSPKAGVEKTVDFYIGRGIGTVEIQEAEIEEYGYFSFEEALGKITYEESKTVLRKAYMLIEERKKRRSES
ncbi:bis(5'-nucleosyl)-tetraphosphatase [Youngiibacter fragilis]|uniref:Bis(5'-nucleosyl)-tetraphosphatase [asymmetrical] n=1 Tax=Youngiibacter fragilis 232.1 TaxID=994573 RepID=V7I4Y4_9CLOT|nr:NUDIX domain-containing protein [Youngiibacter fragilis]ETA81300.1 DNA mistmatch repair protein MutT [Youngiibacter fragilis 232.1]